MPLFTLEQLQVALLQFQAAEPILQAAYDADRTRDAAICLLVTTMKVHWTSAIDFVEAWEVKNEKRFKR